MHRMRRFVASLGLPLAALTLLSGRAAADLIRPVAERTYPAIAADDDGLVSYTRDAAGQGGRFHLTNTPLLLAGGPTVAAEVQIQPQADGVRSQVLDVALDGQGHFVRSASNTYELYGTIVANGQIFSGLLLKGEPTSFGSRPRDPLDATKATDLFDLDVKITGGELATRFGRDAYMQVSPTCDSTFDGSFLKDFTGKHPTTTLRAEHAPSPFPVPAPEPTTLALLIAGGCGLALGKGRKSS